MVTTKKAEKQKRNDPCACGGGRKFKNCCKELQDFVDAPVDGETYLKLLYLIVNSLKGHDACITKRTLDAMPIDWKKRLKVEPGVMDGVKAYLIAIKQPETPKIIGADSEIIIP